MATKATEAAVESGMEGFGGRDEGRGFQCSRGWRGEWRLVDGRRRKGESTKGQVLYRKDVQGD